jgi:hypothetical protein
LIARRSSLPIWAGAGRLVGGPDSRDVDGSASAGSADASRQLGAVARTGRTAWNSRIGIVGRMVSVGWLRLLSQAAGGAGVARLGAAMGVHE